jgi:hypothetical protein
VPDRIQTPEPFVSADVAAKFLGINRRMLLAMARMGIAGAYAIGTGSVRKHWIFRLSELIGTVKNFPIHKNGESCDPASGSPR